MAAVESEPVVQSKAKKVMIGVDESEESLHALKWTIVHDVLQPADEVVLLHIQPLPHFYDVGGSAGSGGLYATPELILAMKHHYERATESILENAKKICEESEVRATTLVKVGDTREAICDVVEKEHADLLILGSHGYGAIKRAFLGSVSDYCVHKAKCPVLIVKKPHHH